MPSLTFQQQFADRVSGGQKRQTIRAIRKRPVKVGDVLHLFTGMRTRKCRRLGTARCTAVEEITIGVGPFHDEILGYNDRRLDAEERAKLARADGFACVSEMLGWFRETHGLPFHGHVIHWVLI